MPPPRFHTVRYAGVLAPASKMRPRIVPKPPVTPANDLEPTLEPRRGGSRYRPWAELLKRCFSIDVLRCPSCDGRLRLVALLTDPDEVRRFLRGIGASDPDGVRQPGSLQTDAFQGHLHSIPELVSGSGSIGEISWTGDGGATYNNTGVPLTDGSNGTPRTVSCNMAMSLAFSAQHPTR